MERNFTNENLERFLRQNADSLKMRPRASVWKGIANNLSRRKRRTIYIFGSLLLIATAIGYQVMNLSGNHLQSHPLTRLQNKTIPVPDYSASSNVSGQQLGIIAKKESLKPLSHVSSEVKISSGSLTAPLIRDQVNVTNTYNEITPSLIEIHPENTGISQVVNELPHNTLAEPISIETILGSFKSRTDKKKINFEVYFTPTISYRKLSENKSYSQQSSPVGIASYPAFYNINSAVTHKPDFGFEIGTTAKYAISNKLKLRGGLQFNINRYDIKAFNAPAQLATIRLNNRYSPDSLNAITPYSNLNGYHSDWLQNFYFQVSAPVGVELKLRGDDKMQFGIATTIQPTYLIGDRVYLISTDYKNYAEVPWLVRRWNVNTSLETFVSYSTGHLKWQVGPQFRYQLLSSFISKYPVKENLYDFGLKVGISMNHH